jgi:putative endonuclease
MSFYVYVLKSEVADRRYIGSCKDLVARLKQHNSGKVRSSKGYIPYKVVYSETFETNGEALQREKFFKTIDGYHFLKSKGIY